MRYHGDHHVLPLFGPWRWAPYMRGNFHWKKYQNARSFFLSHTSKLNQQKQWEVVSKSTAKIYPSNKYNILPSFIIDQSWNTLQLKNIVLSFHPPFEPISALFTFTGLWPEMLAARAPQAKKHAIWNRFEYRSGWSVLESIPKCLHKSPCTYWILKNDLIL